MCNWNACESFSNDIVLAMFLRNDKHKNKDSDEKFFLTTSTIRFLTFSPYNSLSRKCIDIPYRWCVAFYSVKINHESFCGECLKKCFLIYKFWLIFMITKISEGSDRLQNLLECYKLSIGIEFWPSPFDFWFEYRRIEHYM